MNILDGKALSQKIKEEVKQEAKKLQDEKKITPGLGVILVSSLNPYVAAILLMELMVPLAVNNVNMAALYNCRPHDVTSTILISSLAFIAFIYFYLGIIQHFFGLGI